MPKAKPVTVTLDEPVEIDEGDKKKTVTELTFARKMKAKDMLAMDAVTGEIRKSMALYASMAGVELAVIAELDTDDFEKMAREVAPLMGKRGKQAAEDLAQDEGSAELH